MVIIEHGANIPGRIVITGWHAPDSLAVLGAELKGFQLLQK